MFRRYPCYLETQYARPVFHQLVRPDVHIHHACALFQEEYKEKSLPIEAAFACDSPPESASMISVDEIDSLVDDCTTSSAHPIATGTHDDPDTLPALTEVADPSALNAESETAVVAQKCSVAIPKRVARVSSSDDLHHSTPQQRKRLKAQIKRHLRDPTFPAGMGTIESLLKQQVDDTNAFMQVAQQQGNNDAHRIRDRFQSKITKHMQDPSFFAFVDALETAWRDIEHDLSREIAAIEQGVKLGTQ